MDPAKIRDLKDRLGYTFNDKGLLIRALTHSTFSNAKTQKKNRSEDCPHQRTYATLGDAILKAGFVSLLMEKGVKTPLNKFDCVTNGGRA
jgi:dsRNA-specific ribonuclease